MRLLIAILLLSLAGCGFHLQGTTPESSRLPELQMTGLAATHPLMQALQARRSFYGEASHDVSIRLNIDKQQWQRRALSYANDGTAIEYELRYEVRFSLYSADDVLQGSHDVFVSGSFGFSPDLLLAKSVEEAALKDDVAAKVAEKIIRRIAYSPAE